MCSPRLINFPLDAADFGADRKSGHCKVRCHRVLFAPLVRLSIPRNANAGALGQLIIHHPQRQSCQCLRAIADQTRKRHPLGARLRQT